MQYGVSTDAQHPCGIAHPTGIQTHVNDLVLHLGQTASVAVVQQETPPGTRRVLAQVTLCAAVCSSTFDDLLAVTVGTSDRDEGHEPLLVIEHCHDEAQCAINRSPSPLLEHYRCDYKGLNAMLPAGPVSTCRRIGHQTSCVTNILSLLRSGASCSKPL